MDPLQILQEEIAERLCTLPREKLVELIKFLKIDVEKVTNVTRLSLIGLLSNYLLRAETKDLEDGGMAELLSINDKLSEIMVSDVTESEPRPDPKLREKGNVERERIGEGSDTFEPSLPTVQSSMPVNQNPSLRQMDSVTINPSHALHGQMMPAVWHREFKISGLIGELGQKDRLTFSSLARQIESGLNKGYPEQEIVDSVIRAITPGLQLRSYLEGKSYLTLPMLRRILRSHYQEKNATELYKQLTAESQRAKETPQSFLIRVLDLRQKTLFASQEDDSGLKYDPALVQNMFLHTVLTGLQNDRIQSDLQPYLTDTTVTDETLLEKLNVACSHEAERQSKRKGERSAAVYSAQLDEPSPPVKNKPKYPKVDVMSQLKSLSEEIMQIKKSIQQPSPVLQQCCNVNNDVPTLREVHQPLPEENHVLQKQAWGPSQRGTEQHQHPFQLPCISPLQQQWGTSPVPTQFVQPAYLPHYPAQGYHHQQQLHTGSQHHTATPFSQPFHQSRPARTRQCFQCQQARTTEMCTHCYRCGSNEHFLAGCKERGSQSQSRPQLNRNGSLPRDRK